MRQHIPGNSVSDLLKLRMGQITRPDPNVLYPRSCAIGNGQSDDDAFLSVGVPLYVDSIIAQVSNPGQFDLSNLKAAWQVILWQPVGGLLASTADYLVYTMNLPVDADLAVLEIVRSAGLLVSPAYPLLVRARLATTEVGILFPVAQLQVTVMLAVKAELVTETSTNQAEPVWSTPLVLPTPPGQVPGVEQIGYLPQPSEVESRSGARRLPVPPAVPWSHGGTN